jgi:glycosyltransferase involved in cell wall biosynthesis
MAKQILHVVPALARRYGGPSVAALEMCRSLQRAGAAVAIATTDADGGGRLRVPIGTLVPYGDVPAIFFPRRGPDSFKWAPELGRWLRERVAEFDAVHVHGVFSYSTLAAGRACTRAGVPYLVRPLGSLDPWSLRRHRLRKLLLLRLGLRGVLLRAAAMHYTTTEEQRLAESSLPGLPRGVPVPLGLEAPWFEAPAPSASRRPVVLMLSRLDPKKSIETAIAAWHRLAAGGRTTGWSLTVAGDGAPGYVRTLQHASADGAAAGQIRFVGWVSGAERQELIRTSSVFLLPSKQENFGIAVAEAMASATPVIVTPHVNLAPEIARQGAGWVVERNVEALTGTLDAAMSDAAARADRGAAGRTLAEQFRWPAVAAALDTLYDEIIGSRAPRATVDPVRAGRLRPGAER